VRVLEHDRTAKAWFTGKQPNGVVQNDRVLHHGCVFHFARTPDRNLQPLLPQSVRAVCALDSENPELQNLDFLAIGRRFRATRGRAVENQLSIGSDTVSSSRLATRDENPHVEREHNIISGKQYHYLSLPSLEFVPLHPRQYEILPAAL
jgi:hypothetical protein